MEDAIKYDSFFHQFEIEICHGNVDEILKTAPHMIKGSCRTGNQKHYYMEVQSCLVVPQGKDDVVEIYSSTQAPTHLAKAAADLLGVHQNKIKVHVKCVGGSFGGKEWKSIVVAQPAILAAKKFQRPVRCVLERNQDNLIGGGRIPYLVNYTVGFDDQGKILACDFDIYLNCGYSLEGNQISLRNTLDHIENAFRIPAVRARGRLCKTNIPSNTTMTGFGVPEGQFPINCIIEEIAEYLKKDSAQIAELNLYKEADIRFSGQKMENCTIRNCWKECLENSKYWEKKEDIENFNCKNRYIKRGISIVPSKFGIDRANLLQADALVNVYMDGSVLLSHSGVEMGQGLHAKIIQLVTRVLEISAEKIYIDETATHIVPNSGVTVATLGFDFYGEAVIEACKQIKERLRPYREANPLATWDEVVLKAHSDKVSLTSTGFTRHKWEKSNPKTNTGNPLEYLYGAACSEVEVNVLCGDNRIIRTDIVIDLSSSLNPAVDIGQIEGAFMQGVGLFVMEETLYSPEGALISSGFASYKLPGVGDIPGEFNVSLLSRRPNCRPEIYSKAVGEPPLILASSVYFAIKDAIKAARKENGDPTAFCLPCPATVEKIRMACTDQITKMIPEDTVPHRPWTVTV